MLHFFDFHFEETQSYSEPCSREQSRENPLKRENRLIHEIWRVAAVFGLANPPGLLFRDVFQLKMYTPVAWQQSRHRPPRIYKEWSGDRRFCCFRCYRLSSKVMSEVRREQPNMRGLERNPTNIYLLRLNQTFLTIRNFNNFPLHLNKSVWCVWIHHSCYCIIHPDLIRSKFQCVRRSSSLMFCYIFLRIFSKQVGNKKTQSLTQKTRKNPLE